MASQDLSANNFNILIAYVIPGFTTVCGLPIPQQGHSSWALTLAEPTVAGILVSTVEALFVGLTVSTFRWLVIDNIHRRYGITPPKRNFAILESRTHAFELIVAHQYTYYKFYSNTSVALAWSFITIGWKQGVFGWVYPLLIAVFFIGSRDTLKAYYERSGQLLREPDISGFNNPSSSSSK